MLEVRIANRSDAEYVLDSRGDAPFHGRSDLVRVAPQDTTRLLVKPGERTTSVPLAFEVLNAVIEPETHPITRFDVRVPAGSEAGGGN